ncbi:hypothetical protein MAR_001491 [Mya arenaria]|uniref:Uncharacterized protein n=1 Tax=Mya arenaria TaxID=6604 RepID=A0ABY7FBX5_MYAAR|nr:hypothetical protein MAR_001491 [Mya arenaria]
MQLQPFDIEVIKKGPNSAQSATLTYAEMCTNMAAHIHAVKSLPTSYRRIEQNRIKTKNNEQLQAVQMVILKGRPGERKLCNTLTTKFCNHRDEYVYDDGLTLRGPRALHSDNDQGRSHKSPRLPDGDKPRSRHYVLARYDDTDYGT